MVSSHRRQEDTQRGGDTRLYTIAIALLAVSHLTPWRGPADDYVGFIAHKFR